MGWLTFDDLTETECWLANAVVSGRGLDLVEPGEALDEDAMADWDADREVRAELIRQVLLGGFGWSAGVSPDPRGISLRGARLIGALDLAEVRSPLPLQLTDCYTTEVVRLTGSQLSTVDLSGLVGPGIVAYEAAIERIMRLTGVRLDGASKEGTLNLVAAHIGGVLELSGARLTNADPDGTVLYANNLRTGAGVFLNRGFQAEGGGGLGTIRLSAADIGGQLNLGGARVSNPAGPALVGDYLRTGSNLMLNHGFHAEGRHGVGTVRLVGARIGGQLMCEFGAAIAAEPGALAINLSRSHVAGDVLLPASFSTGLVGLDGFTYDGITRYADVTEWLALIGDRTSHYASQPYHQLAAAHQAAGRERDVRRINVASQRDLLRRGQLDLWGRLWHRTIGLTLGYGYRPSRALAWWAGTLLLAAALMVGVAGPAGLVTAGGHGAPCSTVEEIGLALNAATPLVKPGSQQTCQLTGTDALGQALIVATWVLQALSWAFVTLFVAGFTGLVRKTR